MYAELDGSSSTMSFTNCSAIGNLAGYNGKAVVFVFVCVPLLSSYSSALETQEVESTRQPTAPTIRYPLRSA